MLYQYIYATIHSQRSVNSADCIRADDEIFRTAINSFLGRAEFWIRVELNLKISM